MIITTQDRPSLNKENETHQHPTPAFDHEPEAPPPTYEEVDSSFRHASTSQSQPNVAPPPRDATASQRTPTTHQRAPPHPKATNYVSIYKHLNSTIESFFIDPTLRLHQSLLPPLLPGETDATRKNINLGTTMGIIDVDITVLGEDSSQELAPRCYIQVKNKMGLSSVRVHASDSPHRHPIHLRMFSRAGSMNIQLPRAFNGLITIVGLGQFMPSNQMSTAIRALTNKGKGSRYVLGDIASSPWNDRKEEVWAGDECVVEASLGAVTLSFDDEDPHDPGSSTPVFKPSLGRRAGGGLLGAGLTGVLVLDRR